jgi:hypothetical protein
VLNNDLPMLGIVAGHTYGVAPDHVAQDNPEGKVHLLEFKSGTKASGTRALEVRALHVLTCCSILSRFDSSLGVVRSVT